jgi:hypothetical protein
MRSRQDANFVLVDEGTMDTVIQCLSCDGRERFNFDPTACGECSDTDEDVMECTHYDEFIEDCVAECEATHFCNS